MAAVPNPAGVGRPGFVAEHGLHTPEQQEAAEKVIARIESPRVAARSEWQMRE